MATPRHSQPATGSSLVLTLSLMLISPTFACQEAPLSSTTEEPSNKKSSGEEDDNKAESASDDSNPTPDESDASSDSSPSLPPSNNSTGEDSDTSESSSETVGEESPTETDETDESDGDSESTGSESTGEEDDASSDETGEKMGVDDKAACSVFSSMEVEEVVAAEVESEATQAIVLPSTEKAYRIKLPEGKIGYVTYEIEDWDSVQAFYTDEAIEYSLWVIDGKTEMPKTKAMSCPDSPITEQLVHLQHWTPVRVEFAAEGPREVWFMAYFSDRQQTL